MDTHSGQGSAARPIVTTCPFISSGLLALLNISATVPRALLLSGILGQEKADTAAHFVPKFEPHNPIGLATQWSVHDSSGSCLT